MEQINQMIQEMQSNKLFPGACVAFVNHDDTTYHCFGQTIDGLGTIYDEASLTKVLVTTPLILMLIEQGKLSLNTRVCDIRHSYPHQTTIELLLLHTSGLPADMKVDGLNKETLLSAIDKQTLTYEPFTKVVYSDLGYLLLGDIIERVCQLPLDVVFDQFIKQPLGLKETWFNVPKDKQMRCAPTEVKPNRGLVQGVVHDGKGYVMEGVAGSAGLFSSIMDVSTMVKAYWSEDVFKHIASMYQTTYIKDETVSRTLGWIVRAPGIIYHTGFTGTSILLDLNQERAFIWLSNQVHYGRDNKPLFNEKREAIIKEVIKQWTS